MDAQLSSQRIWLALSLLGVAYALTGWYLAAHHIFWLVGAFVVVTITIAWRNNPILEFLTWLVKQQTFVLIIVSLCFSLVVALIYIEPILFSIVLSPLITLFYALLEMRAAKLERSDVFLWLLITASSGLIIGEVIDLLVMPSIRY